MKRNSIVCACFLAVLYVTLSSDIDGAAHHGHGDVTGAHTATIGHCQTSSCHGGNNAMNIVLLQVKDTTTLLPVTTYHAGQTYMVTITGDATAVTSNLPGFGFMVSAALGNHTLAGSYTIPSALSGNIHTFACGATTVVEHSLVLPQTITGTNKYATWFYWTAPTTYSDSVTFYGLLNAVNGNGASSGDYPNAATPLTIYEDDPAAVATVAHSANDITLYPNPATTSLTIQAGEQITSLVISNTLGQKVFSGSYNATQARVDVAALPAGTYLVSVNGSRLQKFVKQ